MSEKMWGGRFAGGTDALVEAFTSSIAVDKRLYAHDIEGSVAHVKTLARAGVLAEEEAKTLVAGLGAVKKEIESGNFVFTDALEDIHMHVESRLTELLGPVAKKVHTGRSRNDQVALDLRLYLRDEVRAVLGLLGDLKGALLTQSADHLDTVMPGYTHLQRAQPVLLAHHLLAYFEMFSRDSERFRECLARVNVMPLGSAALAGTTFPVDRAFTAGLLGFSGVTENSLDAVSDRDFALDFVSAAAIAMMHLSRLAEELVLWSSAEFNFVRLPDAFTTGSSLMPQKKNPDVAELTRGKTGRVYGDLTALLTLMKGLPLAYNRDMQEDKIPVFDAADTLKSALAVFARMTAALSFNRERLAEAADRGYLNATDLADYLVGKGVPFREAHSMAGRAVAYGVEKGRELGDLTLSELRESCPAAGEDVFAFLETRAVVDRRACIGGTARERVAGALAAARKRLDSEL